MDGLKNLYELCVAKSEKPVAYFLNGGLEEKPEGIGQREREMIGRIKTWNEWTKKLGRGGHG